MLFGACKAGMAVGIAIQDQKYLITVTGIGDGSPWLKALDVVTGMAGAISFTADQTGMVLVDVHKSPQNLKSEGGNCHPPIDICKCYATL